MTFHHQSERHSAWSITRMVAESPPSDFDFKLTLNVHPSDRDSGNTYDDYDEDDAPVDGLISEIDATLADREAPAGFMLLRAKTYIVCRHRGHRDYTNKQIKIFRSDLGICSRHDFILILVSFHSLFSFLFFLFFYRMMYYILEFSLIMTHNIRTLILYSF